MENEGRAAGPPEFGTLLRSFRLTVGLSQEALAERAGMSAHGIRALERGYRRTPQRGTLALLSGALALSDEQQQELEVAAARWVLLRVEGKASVTVGPWPDTPTSNLPLSLASFVGRERELSEIATLVRQHRLVTITGSGGVGKTQTALQVTTAPSDASAAWFVGLAPLRDPSLVASAIASALRVQEAPNRPPLETLLEYLKHKTLLLILDNCEHVVMQAATVADALLANCPRVRILATSREPLRAVGERIYRIPSLSSGDSSALFSDRARAVDHRFALTDDNAPAVAELCRRLDGIPLAIELAAARVDSLSIAVLVERLEARFRVLAGGGRTALPRQQTMRATIDWSYDLLSASEQRVFERLSIFAGGCTPASAQAVCAGEDVATAEVFDLISSLVDKSVVVAEFDGIEPRYRLLESFRQYACEKLVDRGEERIVALRHAIACLDFAEWLSREHESESDEIRVARARAEWDNWRATLEWALTNRGDVVLGQRLAGELYIVWSCIAPVEGRRWMALALSLVDEATPSSVIARLHEIDACAAWLFADWSAQLTSSEAALRLYRELGNDLGVGRTQMLAAHGLGGLGRNAEAEALLREALPNVRRRGSRKTLAFVLSGLASARSAIGDLAAARTYLAESSAIFTSLGASMSVANTTFALSELEFYAGNAELAVQLAMDALDWFRAFNDTRLASRILSAIAEYLVWLDRYDEAEARAREALDLAIEAELLTCIGDALEKLATVATLRMQGAGEQKLETDRHAAQLLGFAGPYCAEARQPYAQQGFDRVLAVLRDAMGADAVTNLMAEGALMTQEQAVATAAKI